MSGQGKLQPGLQFIQPRWPVPPRVRALATTRQCGAGGVGGMGGASRGAYASFNIGAAVGDDPAAVAKNRAALRALLPAEPLWLKQVHGTRIVEAGSAFLGTEADGAVARTPGVVLAIQSADCLPVLLADKSGRVIAAAHAGWRGLAEGVIENAVVAMAVEAADIVAWLGPAIGPASYEVGAEVRAAFVSHDAAAATAFAPRARPGKYLADLYALARQRLQAVGVREVHGGGFCTLREHERFFSFRRDGQTGRMATLLWLEDR
jgi:YfiH family protein